MLSSLISRLSRRGEVAFLLGILLHYFSRRAAKKRNTRAVALCAARRAPYCTACYLRYSLRVGGITAVFALRVPAEPTCLFPFSMSPKVVTYKMCDAFILTSSKKSWSFVTLCSNLGRIQYLGRRGHKSRARTRNRRKYSPRCCAERTNDFQYCAHCAILLSLCLTLGSSSCPRVRYSVW